MNPYAAVLLVDGALAVALLLVLVPACRDSRRSFVARRADLEQQLGRPAGVAEVWTLYR